MWLRRWRDEAVLIRAASAANQRAALLRCATIAAPPSSIEVMKYRPRRRSSKTRTQHHRFVVASRGEEIVVNINIRRPAIVGVVAWR